MTYTPGVTVAGQFDDWKSCEGFACWKCKSKNTMFRVWESSCGGWEDYNYKCVDCGHTWWVDGIDS